MSGELPPYLREMARIVEPAPPADVAAARRLRVAAEIDAMARQVRRREQVRKRWVRSAVVVSAAALVLGAVGFGATSLRAVGSGELARSDSPRHEEGVSSARPVTDAPSAGGSIAKVTPAPHDVVGSDAVRHEAMTVGAAAPSSRLLPSGARLLAHPLTRLSMTSEAVGAFFAEQIQLQNGKVELEVPPLGDGRLRVMTPEAVVEVRGTAFSVERTAAGDGSRTEVRVVHGRVGVLSGGGEILLGPGDSWSSVTGGAPKVTPAAPKAVTPKDAAPTASQLVEQNRLYQTAMHARRQGLDAAARVRLEELLRRFPDSPLADSARRELGRMDARPEE